MIIGKVVGTVVATRKEEELVGLKFLAVSPIDLRTGTVKDGGVIAVEKDDDFNFHIGFITHISNLRSDNYHIKNSDFHKVKLVAGRIIPAIATTNAVVAGFEVLQAIRIVVFDTKGGRHTRLSPSNQAAAQAQWEALAGLVADGVAFSRARAR